MIDVRARPWRAAGLAAGGVAALLLAVGLVRALWPTTAKGDAAFARADYAAAAGLYKWPAAFGSRKARETLGLQRELGLGVAADPAQAARWYELAAVKGSVYAAFKAGVMHANGVGVKRDEAKAARFMRQAAEAGMAPAQALYADALSKGAGVAKDKKAAAGWFRKAAEQGEPNGLLGLGAAYLAPEEHGLAKDPAQARLWLERAAKRGVGAAAELLAFAHLDGTAGRKDPAAAAAWFRKAAAAGQLSTLGMVQLADLHEAGQGVPKDLVETLKWRALAADAGHAESAQKAGALMTRMKSRDRDEAGRRAARERHAMSLAMKDAVRGRRVAEAFAELEAWRGL